MRPVQCFISLVIGAPLRFGEKWHLRLFMLAAEKDRQGGLWVKTTMKGTRRLSKEKKCKTYEDKIGQG